MADVEEQIRQRAHQIWEEEGRPDGREREHWQQAADEVAAADRDLSANPGIGSGAAAEPASDVPLGGASTFEGDVLNDTTPAGGIDPSQRGRSNK